MRIRGVRRTVLVYLLAYFACIAGKKCYHICMNSAHKKTLAAVFARQTPRNLEWSRIEALLAGCGCGIFEGRGSRVTFFKGPHSLDAHRPHPGKEAKPYQVRDARAFLEKLGITPKEEGI